MTNQPDPRKIKVQLNVPISWEFMDHLDQLSASSRTSKSKLVRTALETAYPLPGSVKV